jgi:putative endonuclease
LVFSILRLNMYFVYILYSVKLDRYYVGSTGNLEDRLKRHNSGRSTYTKPGIPWKLVYSKQYQTRSEAYSAEQYIKSQKSRMYIERLIENS